MKTTLTSPLLKIAADIDLLYRAWLGSNATFTRPEAKVMLKLSIKLIEMAAISMEGKQ